MKLLCSSFGCMPRQWSKMPEPLQKDPTTLIQAIVSQDNFVYIERNEIDETVLQEALPTLLADHRKEAVKACERGVLKWHEVNPTKEEWCESIDLSMWALREGLAQSLDDVTALTPAIINALLKCNRLKWKNVPIFLRNDQEFCRLVLDPNAPPEQERLFNNVPRYNTFDPFDAERTEIHIKIFQQHPVLVQDFAVWDKILNDTCPYAPFRFGELFKEGIQRLDANMVKRACRIDDALLDHIDQLTFSDVVKEVIDQDLKLIFHVKRAFVETFPHYLKEKIGQLRSDDLDADGVYDLGEAISQEMWGDDDFTQTWFRAGLPLLNGQPEAWNVDRDKLLLVAEYGAIYSSAAFARAPEALRGDVNFIKQAMKFERSLFEYATETVRNEYSDLAIWALEDENFIRRCFDGIEDQRRGHRGFGFARNRIILSETKMTELYLLARSTDSFVNPFLCAAHNKQLVLGNVEPVQILKNICEFLGVPQGGGLDNVRKFIAAHDAAAESRDSNEGEG